MKPDPPALFVYGSLRHGEEGHHHLEGRYEQRTDAVLSGFVRREGGHGFPTIAREADQSVTGELYVFTSEKCPKILAACDQYEGIPEGGDQGEWYRREVVTVETSDGETQAWAYVET